MSDQLTNIMKHFGTFYMTEENDEFLIETIEEIKNVLQS